MLICYILPDVNWDASNHCSMHLKTATSFWAASFLLAAGATKAWIWESLEVFKLIMSCCIHTISKWRPLVWSPSIPKVYFFWALLRNLAWKPGSPSPDTGIPIEILSRHHETPQKRLLGVRCVIIFGTCFFGFESPMSMIFHDPSYLGSCPIPSDLTLRVSGNLRSCASPQKLWAHCPEKLPRRNAVSGGTLWPRDGRGLLSSTWPLPCLSCLEWWLGRWTLSQKWIWMIPIPIHCTAIGFQPFWRIEFSTEDILRI